MEQRFSGKKCIVTGGLGFVGSHLVNHLIDEGANVLVIDNLSSGSEENRDERMPDDQVLIGDFTNFDFTLKVFEQFKPNYVFHVGAWGRMPMCMDDPVGAYRNNVIGTVNVLEASRRAGVKKVVLSSSCIVYCEETPYKSTKVALEDVARVYRKAYDLPTICLRYGNIYGTRQRIGMDSAMFAMLRDSYNKTGEINIFGDGEQTRDWVNVADICEANMIAALSLYQGELDIATGTSISLNYIVDVLKKITPDIKVNYLCERLGDAKHIRLNPEYAKESLFFKTKVKFEDGVKEIWK